jgi:hydrogenase expression/formation protein HypC
VCLAIPGQVVELVDEPNRLARVEVAGVRRVVNVGLLDGSDPARADGADGGVGPGDWVLIHVGFALSRIDEREAIATRRLLEAMGAEYETELAELRESAIE